MTSSPTVRQQRFDEPATYLIRVYGPVAAGWSDRLSGMVITVGATADGMPVTSLLGELPNQAALAKVLDALYDMQAALISIECLTCDGPARD